MDETSARGSFSKEACNESSGSKIGINIKTLDSQIYTFCVDKNMPVPMLKEKIADATGITVEQQRLIYRGKVVKDDHSLSDYQLEDGHTLHLVERQPVQAHHSPSPSSQQSGRDNANQGNGASANPQNVVLGAVNVVDQGDAVAGDIGGRIVGAVLTALGVGASNAVPTATANRNPPRVETVGQNGNARIQAGNPGQPGVMVLNNSVPFVPPVGQLPHVIPDSLTTLNEFLNRMNSTFRNIGLLLSPSPANIGELQRYDIPRRIPNAETLGLTIGRVQQLLSGNVSAALSLIAARLEGEASSTDATIRDQIQSQVAHMGTAMQHLGAMLLELGRATMTLQMGQSPAECWVNAGPAIYISSMGPNPLTIQPFPQTSFTVPPPILTGLSLPLGTADVSRNVSIHIQSVTPVVQAAGTGGSTLGVPHGEHRNMEQESTNAGESAYSDQMPGLPSIAVEFIPGHSGTDSTGHAPNNFIPFQTRLPRSGPGNAPGFGQGSDATVNIEAQINPLDSMPNAAGSDSMSNMVMRINATLASFIPRNGQSRSTAPVNAQPTASQSSHSYRNGESGNDSTQECNSGLDTVGNAEVSNSAFNMLNMPARHTMEGASLPLALGTISSVNNDNHATHSDPHLPDDYFNVTCQAQHGLSESEQKKARCDERHSSKSNTDNSLSLGGDTSNSISNFTGSSSVSLAAKALSDGSKNDSLQQSTVPPLVQPLQQDNELHEGEKPAPLGLGIQGLPGKRQVKTKKAVMKDDESRDMPPTSQNQHITRGQSVMQALVSQRPEECNLGTNSPAPSLVGGQADVGSLMSQVIQSPVLNGLLTEVANQVDGGSPANLRNMLEQCIQSPGINSMLNNIVQQIQGHDQDIDSMSLESRRDQGGIDLSSMFRQMLPIVSQAIGDRSSNYSQVRVSEHQAQGNNDSLSGVGDMENSKDHVGLQQVLERIAQHDSMSNIFRAELERAASLRGEESYFGDLVEYLSNAEELIHEFGIMLRNHLRRRLQD